MGAIAKLFAAVDALQAGKSLSNPELWKKVQGLMPVFLLIIGAIVKVFGLDIPEPDQATIALGLATLGVAVNGYLTVATTDKLGIKKAK